jgi:tetratricopeptide (TPR) repeat protein
MAFFALIGNFGTRGAIAAVIALTIFNAAFSVFLLRRISGLQLSKSFLWFSIAYFFLLYSSPYFYVFYSQDAFAQLSFFLLVVGLAIYTVAYRRHLITASVVLFFFSLVAFLAKETYILSAVGLAGLYFIFSPASERLARLVPLSAIVFALILSLTIGLATKSVFLGLAGGPYQTDFSPFSLAREWLRYAADSLNLLSCTALVLAVLACLLFDATKGKSNAAIAVFCILAASAAWLPNATLPQHYFSGYSWNGAYLLFLPIVLVASTVRRSTASVGLALVITAAVFASPVLNRRKYEGNAWTLQQEATQRNLLTVLRTKFVGLPLYRPTHVLITGQTFPFSPFSYPRALEEMEGGRQIYLGIVSYSSELIRDSKTVHFLKPAAVDISRYDAVLELRPDGTLRDTTTSVLSDAAAIGCPIRWCFVLFPVMADFTKPADGVFSASQYREIGLMWLTYSEYAAAARAFRKSTELDPRNPYTFFYLGNTLKIQGELTAAAAAYAHAVEIDNPANRNPYFQSSLIDVQQEIKRNAP